MLNASIDDLLGDLLVEIHRGLVQYVHEAWPWKRNGDEAAYKVINQLAQAQQEHARQLFQLLLKRGIRPSLGNYPADFTSLHFVSLEFLYPLIVQGQKQLVEQLTQAIHNSASEPDVQRILNTILTGEQQGLKQLEAISPAARPLASLA